MRGQAEHLISEAEIRSGVVVAHILHNLFESLYLRSGIEAVFDEVAEHVAEYSALELVAGM